MILASWVPPRGVLGAIWEPKVDGLVGAVGAPGHEYRDTRVLGASCEGPGGRLGRPGGLGGASRWGPWVRQGTSIMILASWVPPGGVLGAFLEPKVDVLEGAVGAPGHEYRDTCVLVPPGRVVGAAWGILGASVGRPGGVLGAARGPVS